MDLTTRVTALLERLDSVFDIYYIPFLIAHVLLYIGLVHTAAYSRWRYPIVAAIVTCCTISVRSRTSLSIPGSAGGQYIWGMMMSSSHWLLLAHAVYPTSGKVPAWRWGLDMLRSARWGVSQKILPKFNSIPTKHQLMISRTWDLFWTLGLLYLVRTYTLYIFDFDFQLSPEGFLHRLPEVSAREWLVRIYLTLRGKGEPYLMLRAGHSFFTLVGLLLGDEPKDWPPLFGKISGAYRVRSFYIFFWHHLVRKVFTSHAAFLTNTVLRVPLNTPTSRYMILALSFTISAMMHIYVDPQTPLRCSVWPQFRYYLSIAGAIILEDLLIAGYKVLRRKRRSNIKAKAEKVDAKEATLTEAKSTAIEVDNATTKKRGQLSDTTSTSKDGQEVKPNEHTKEALESSPVGKAEEDDDLFLRIMPWIGYVWVFFFEVWSCSKLLYIQKQCTIPKQYDWDWLVKQIQAGGLEDSDVSVPDVIPVE